MNTIIKLKGLPSQIVFDESITGIHLREVLLNPHFLMVRVVFRILGKEFIMNTDWYRVHSVIRVIFLAMTSLSKKLAGEVCGIRADWSTRKQKLR